MPRPRAAGERAARLVAAALALRLAAPRGANADAALFGPGAWRPVLLVPDGASATFQYDAAVWHDAYPLSFGDFATQDSLDAAAFARLRVAHIKMELNGVERAASLPAGVAGKYSIQQLATSEYSAIAARSERDWGCGSPVGGAFFEAQPPDAAPSDWFGIGTGFAFASGGFEQCGFGFNTSR